MKAIIEMIERKSCQWRLPLKDIYILTAWYSLCVLKWKYVHKKVRRFWNHWKITLNKQLHHFRTQHTNGVLLLSFSAVWLKSKVTKLRFKLGLLGFGFNKKIIYSIITSYKVQNHILEIKFDTCLIWIKYKYFYKLNIVLSFRF